MSVLIKGMEMPTRCFACPMCEVENAEVNCAISHGSYIEYREVDPKVAMQDRPEWCPLIEMPTWIPVTERLPDFEGMCLCMRKSYSKAKFRHQEIMYFDYDGQGFFSNVEGIFVADGNVTHWMPLPKPPEDGET